LLLELVLPREQMKHPVERLHFSLDKVQVAASQSTQARERLAEMFTCKLALASVVATYKS
jgi:hypothetical protein